LTFTLPAFELVAGPMAAAATAARTMAASAAKTSGSAYRIDRIERLRMIPPWFGSMIPTRLRRWEPDQR
jgi:hypothetical protein